MYEEIISAFQNWSLGTGAERNFERDDQAYPDADTGYFGVRYNYDSIMHYGKTYFSKNGQNTIDVLVRISNKKLNLINWSKYITCSALSAICKFAKKMIDIMQHVVWDDSRKNNDRLRMPVCEIVFAKIRKFFKLSSCNLFVELHRCTWQWR